LNSKLKKIGTILTLLILGLISCSKEEIVFTGNCFYLPLAVGNWWQYTRSSGGTLILTVTDYSDNYRGYEAWRIEVTSNDTDGWVPASAWYGYDGVNCMKFDNTDWGHWYQICGNYMYEGDTTHGGVFSTHDMLFVNHWDSAIWGDAIQFHGEEGGGYDPQQQQPQDPGTKYGYNEKYAANIGVFDYQVGYYTEFDPSVLIVTNEFILTDYYVQ
jgi:hypothetical protein